jgi:hypothetical protein
MVVGNSGGWLDPAAQHRLWGDWVSVEGGSEKDGEGCCRRKGVKE